MTASVLTDRRHITRAIIGVAGVWGFAVVVGAETGFFASLPLPFIAAIVAVSIVVPTLIYAASPRLQAYADAVGHRSIVLFHTWRVPAALLFFWYGVNGELPTAFWVLAGTGDFIAGSYAVYLMFRPQSVRRYVSFHVFGFADFVVAVGTGLTFTLLQDPRMVPIVALPMALIPLFGVGISGVTHLIAFDMLRRGAAPTRSPQPLGTAAA